MYSMVNVCIAWSALCNLTLTAAPRVVLSGSWRGPCSRSVCVAVSSAAYSVYNAYSVCNAMRMRILLAMLINPQLHMHCATAAPENEIPIRDLKRFISCVPLTVLYVPLLRTSVLPLPKYVPLFPNPYHSSLDTYHYSRIRTILR
jgi:hypothetical protein